MASVQSKTSVTVNFFTPMTRHNMPAQNYACIEHPQFNPHNPTHPHPDLSTTLAPSLTPTTSTPSSPLPTGEDTIVCILPGHPDCESDDDMPDADTPEPLLNSSHMTLAEKAKLIKKW